MIPLSVRGMELVGFVAAFLTTAAFVPQLFRMMRLKSAREISLRTFPDVLDRRVPVAGLRIALDSKPMIASNAVGLGLSGSILLMKMKCDRRSAGKESTL